MQFSSQAQDFTEKNSGCFMIFLLGSIGFPTRKVVRLTLRGPSAMECCPLLTWVGLSEGESPCSNDQWSCGIQKPLIHEKHGETPPFALQELRILENKCPTL